MRLMTFAVAFGLATGCGKSDSSNEAAPIAQDPHPEITEQAQQQQVPEPASADATPACTKQKPAAALVSAVTQDLFGRTPNGEELALANSESFSYEQFIDDSIANSEAETGVTRFVSSLFRLSNIAPIDPTNTAKVELVADLRMEPIMLVLKNLKNPWPEIFLTRQVYCTERTAKLYDYPVFDVEGFVACELPPERRGIMSLASVLRAVPSAFYATNNNYKRVSFAMYIAQGMDLQANTSGDQSGKGIPLAPCVPVTDQRVSTAGLVFGAAAVPRQGKLCASCHAPWNGPISIAYRRFDMEGKLIDLTDIDNLANADTQGVSRDDLKTILQEQDSCWSNDGQSPPQHFEGLPGLSRLIAESPTLGHALGIQIPQNLANISAPTEEMVTSIEQSYNANGETLGAALRGFFLSSTYQCEEE